MSEQFSNTTDFILRGKELDQHSPSPGKQEPTMTMSKLEVKVEGAKPQPESPRPASPTRPAIQGVFKIILKKISLVGCTFSGRVNYFSCSKCVCFY